ncbi:Hef nuclease, partial [Candidatus Woesearchaeota archaeon]|nr:Hef nuclease [Candidatus Woesearchaeota archaeon]
LIIEGIEERELYNEDNKSINSNAIRGFLLSILLNYKIPILFTKNSEDTARFIEVLTKRKKTEHSLNFKRKGLTKEEQIEFILESFPGIGPKTAKKLLQEFKSLNNIFNASQEELTKRIGKKAEVFKIINEEY